jgi:hypothetical protein
MCFACNAFDYHLILLCCYASLLVVPILREGRRGRDRIVDGFTNIYPISVYHH